MVMLIERRSVFLFFFVATLVSGAVAAGCSDSNPPPASAGDDSPHLVTVDGGVTATTGDAAIEEAGLDAAQFIGTPCLDDTSETIDGGAGPTSCPTIGSCSALCTRIATRFKQGVAQVAIHCLTQLGACTDDVATASCVEGALGRACADTSSTSYCSAFVTTCDPNAGGASSNISENDCEHLANALTSTGRTQFSTCVQGKITAGTCPVEVLACVNDLHE